ncbi:unnamed protein product [Periconia digitata]|uniref:WD40 repeat-like protein n=1 Tax=Periconia digitata TaxID=1303443 RepID=A0A9W4XJQ2_9PLEO|nr:unnamed protein product [Periconia digitata]
MEPRKIPGFYFDPEKKKYFQIQAAHHAPAADSKYSTDNILKEKKKETLRKNAEQKEKKVRSETIVRRLRDDPIMSASLDREMGLRKTSYYMRTAWPNAFASRMSTRPKVIVDRPVGSFVHLFDVDPNTRTIYAVHAENQIKRRRTHTPQLPAAPVMDSPPADAGDTTTYFTLNEYTMEPWDELHRLTSPISSLQYLPRSGALAATTYGSDRPPTIHFSDPERDGPYVAEQFTPQDTASIWTARARPISFIDSPSAIRDNSTPANDTDHLAIGTSKALLLFQRLPTGLWDCATVFESDVDVLAVDWMAPTTIVTGCRDGNIHLHDIRSRGSSNILKHPYPISSLKRADDPTRLVCAGLQDSLCLYDIRFSRRSKSPDASSSETKHRGNRSRKKRRKIQHNAYENSSQPVLTFVHSNAYETQSAMDIHPQLGLIAAAQYNVDTAVRIHNLWTGKVVKQIERNGLRQGGQKYLSDVQCLKFVDAEQDGVELWSNWGGSIVKFNL